MPYVDGYVLAVPKKNLPAYCRSARKAGRVWREHGALEFRECAGDDLDVKGMVPFPRSVNAKVMKDPRLAKMMDPKSMPFDPKRMVYGGFKVVVEG
jgi:uncharacterized protein YbaA (DUF1428 family)